MKHVLKTSLMMMAALLAFTGCKKTEEAPAAPAPAPEAPAAEVPAAPADNTDKAPAAEAPAAEAPAADAPAADDDKAPAVALPEIKTKVTKTEFPGGEMVKTTLDLSEKLDVYYEVPNFYIDTPAYEKINKFFNEMSQSYFTKDSMSQILEVHVQEPNREEVYLSAHKSTIMDHTNKYLSVNVCYEWFMGGVFDNGCSGYVFNVETGDGIPLTEYSGKTIDELKGIVEKALREQYEESIDEIEWDVFNKLTSFSYYIKDDHAHVVFKKYEIAVGAAGDFDVVLP